VLGSPPPPPPRVPAGAARAMGEPVDAPRPGERGSKHPSGSSGAHPRPPGVLACPRGNACPRTAPTRGRWGRCTVLVRDQRTEPQERPGLTPRHASPHGVAPGGVRRAKAILCQPSRSRSRPRTSGWNRAPPVWRRPLAGWLGYGRRCPPRISPVACGARGRMGWYCASPVRVLRAALSRRRSHAAWLTLALSKWAL
jgi:hypothetical protein